MFFLKPVIDFQTFVGFIVYIELSLVKI